jgi:hypothetical protein
MALRPFDFITNIKALLDASNLPGGEPIARWALYCPRRSPKIDTWKAVRRDTLQLDDQLKQLLRELGHAINDSVSDSERVAEVISNVRAAGFDIVLKLDASIGLARRKPSSARLTTQDRVFLESLRVRLDDEVMDDPTSENVEMTPQDIKFLKSLKISLDEAS